MNLSHAPLSELATSCREETSKYQRGEPSRNDFCWELVRRAVCDRQDAAWHAIITQYRGIVLAWVRQHPASSNAREDDTYWINRVFERFWSAVGPDRFSQFPDLPSVLKYLTMCVNSVLLDDVRSRRANELESLDVLERLPAGAGGVPAVDAEELAVGEMAGHELWRAIAQEVPDQGERLVVYWSFALGMRPAEIQQRSPDRYPTVADVYRIKRNVIERLRRSERLRQLAA